MGKLIRPSTVVVIEDNPRERASTETALAGRGYRVRSTNDAADGMDCIRRAGADVVVLGLAKKWQTLDLIRRLRGRFEPIPLTDPPRIVVIARDVDEAGERFTRRLGADAVLHRPLQAKQLVRAVAELARREQRSQASAIYEAV